MVRLVAMNEKLLPTMYNKKKKRKEKLWAAARL
jgi:hypothetical protein